MSQLKTDNLFVYFKDNVSPLGPWQVNKKPLFFHISLYLDNGEYDYGEVTKCNEIFRKELSLAPQAIRLDDSYLPDAPH